MVQFLCLETFGFKFHFHFGTPVYVFLLFICVPSDFGQSSLPVWSGAGDQLFCGTHLSLFLTNIAPKIYPFESLVTEATKTVFILLLPRKTTNDTQYTLPSMHGDH